MQVGVHGIATLPSKPPREELDVVAVLLGLDRPSPIDTIVALPIAPLINVGQRHEAEATCRYRHEQ